MIKAKIAELRSQLQGGVSPAMASPLLNDGNEVNAQGVIELTNFLIEAGVNGLFVGGTTGEGILLSTDVRCDLHSQVIKAANGRLPVLLHVGANTTADTLTLARHAREIEAAAIVAVTPYFYGMDDNALFDYFQAIAREVPDLPLLAYDIPHMAVNGITPALVARLGAEIPSFAGIKCSRLDAQAVRGLIDAKTSDSILLAGNERIAAGLLMLGADGLISGFSTAVPEPFVALTKAFTEGNMAEVQRQQLLINQILDTVPASARIGAVKAVLNRRGIEVGSAVPPRPMPPAGWHGWQQIKQLLDTAANAA